MRLIQSQHFRSKVTQLGQRPSENTWFELLTTYKPSPQDVYAAQEDLGYSPKGYGGPYTVTTTKLSSGKYKTTWSCPSSCD